MKRSLLSLVFTLSLSLLGSCTPNNEVNNFDAGNSSSNSLDFGDSNSNTILVVNALHIFSYQGKEYVWDCNLHLTEKDTTGFLGYWNNEEDLEKWKEIDQSDDIFYVINLFNSIYNLDIGCGGKLSNRFELFTTTNENIIAVKIWGRYEVYALNDFLRSSYD